VETAHFRLSTDLSGPAARRAAMELERSRRALLSLWGAELDPPGRVEAIVLRSRDELARFSDDPELTGFATATPQGPLLVAAGQAYALGEEVSLGSVHHHELAHHLSRYVLVRQPRWLAEGLASFLETVALKDGGGQAELGRVHPAHVRWIRQHGHLPFQRLWELEGAALAGPERTSFYASSWLWVHYLISRQRARFNDLQRRLSRAEDPPEAWQQAFQGVSDDELERDLRLYLAEGRWAVLTFEIPEVPPQLRERTLSDADVHVVWARLWQVTPSGRPGDHRRYQARQEIREALRQEPSHAAALLMQAEEEPDTGARIAQARALVRARPDRPEGWSFLASLLSLSGAEPPDRGSVLVRAVELAPDDPAALSALATELARKGNAARAAEHALRAVRLAPWSPDALAVYAEVAAALGRCEDAADAQRRALDALHELTSEEVRARFGEKLQEYERRCAGPAGEALRPRSPCPPGTEAPLEVGVGASAPPGAWLPDSSVAALGFSGPLAERRVVEGFRHGTRLGRAELEVVGIRLPAGAAAVALRREGYGFCVVNSWGTQLWADVALAGAVRLPGKEQEVLLLKLSPRRDGAGVEETRWVPLLLSEDRLYWATPQGSARALVAEEGALRQTGAQLWMELKGKDGGRYLLHEVGVFVRQP
jgi:tetratricopeptide (TPR) repeat protein